MESFNVQNIIEFLKFIFKLNFALLDVCGVTKYN